MAYVLERNVRTFAVYILVGVSEIARQLVVADHNVHVSEGTDIERQIRTITCGKLLRRDC